MRNYQNSNKHKFFGIVIFGLIFSAAVTISAQTLRIVKIVTEPNAIVWLDDVKYGTTDASGNLTVRTSVGAKKLRVRAEGFKETTQNLLPAQKEAKIALVKTTDEAELAFQQAEKLAATDKQKAAAAYRKAISLRPKFAEANLGLARALETSDSEAAFAALKEARKARPIYPEATAVEGRVYKADGEDGKAVAAFKRAITEGKGFQPEAHAGLGLLYQDRAEAAGTANDAGAEAANYQLAASELNIAVKQLSGAPDAEILYQLLGDMYYKMKKYQDAIRTYEEFLRIFPDSGEASAVRSIIVQTKKEMNGEQ